MPFFLIEIIYINLVIRIFISNYLDPDEFPI